MYVIYDTQLIIEAAERNDKDIPRDTRRDTHQGHLGRQPARAETFGVNTSKLSPKGRVEETAAAVLCAEEAAVFALL